MDVLERGNSMMLLILIEAFTREIQEMARIFGQVNRKLAQDLKKVSIE
jgi:hypothetical protein